MGEAGGGWGVREQYPTFLTQTPSRKQCRSNSGTPSADQMTAGRYDMEVRGAVGWKSDREAVSGRIVHMGVKMCNGVGQGK
jgi:hypothetical protein